MILVENHVEEYMKVFKDFPVFTNFIRFLFRDHTPRIHVDQLEHPRCTLMYFYPIYFIAGDYENTEMNDLASEIGENAWIVTDSDGWKDVLEAHYKDQIKSYPRMLFDSRSLDLEKVLSYRKALPDDLRIVPIQEEHLKEGMIQHDVLRKFYLKSHFLDTGFGFALVNTKNEIHGFALTNFPITSNDVELYFRVGYDDFQKYRHQGIGTTLCTYFIEECLKRGYNPVWDAAHEVSAHIARKFGYTDKMKWYMYHVD